MTDVRCGLGRGNGVRAMLGEDRGSETWELNIFKINGFDQGRGDRGTERTVVESHAVGLRTGGFSDDDGGDGRWIERR